MTEIPEHLLKRSRERRAALGLPTDGGTVRTRGRRGGRGRRGSGAGGRRTGPRRRGHPGAGRGIVGPRRESGPGPPAGGAAAPT